MTDTYDTPPDAPIVCTIRPGDDEHAIMDAYRGLFAEAFVSGQRTEWGVRWTFRQRNDIETRVRQQAAFEQGCCPFLRMAITVADGTVVWDVIGPANAAAFLDEYAQLPQTAFGSVDALRDRSIASGLTLNDER
ncbi:hypothetical protein AB0M45_31280 [Nocardia sp. NPDC051787]|uniref:hypothetical protein n=1 Tax=Nocardia sp. NPDC051787 TaxID=3155415 RepID=UPI00343650E4